MWLLTALLCIGMFLTFGALTALVFSESVASEKGKPTHHEHRTEP